MRKALASLIAVAALAVSSVAYAQEGCGDYGTQTVSAPQPVDTAETSTPLDSGSDDSG